MQALSGRPVGLDEVVAQQDNHRRSGFVLAYNNAGYEGLPCRSAKADKAIVPLTQVPFDEVLRYDATFFPDERAAFLGSWNVQRSSIAWGCAAQWSRRLRCDQAMPRRVQGRAAVRR
jgi:hypothetical protein